MRQVPTDGKWSLPVDTKSVHTNLLNTASAILDTISISPLPAPEVSPAPERPSSPDLIAQKLALNRRGAVLYEPPRAQATARRVSPPRRPRTRSGSPTRAPSLSVPSSRPGTSSSGSRTPATPLSLNSPTPFYTPPSPVLSTSPSSSNLKLPPSPLAFQTPKQPFLSPNSSPPTSPPTSPPLPPVSFASLPPSTSTTIPSTPPSRPQTPGQLPGPQVSRPNSQQQKVRRKPPPLSLSTSRSPKLPPSPSRPTTAKTPLSPIGTPFPPNSPILSLDHLTGKQQQAALRLSQALDKIDL